MGTKKKFKQARGIPVPIGIPPLQFRPWSFGQMKPLPAIPHPLNITNAYQSILDIFIPANSWAFGKRLRRHHASGPRTERALRGGRERTDIERREVHQAFRW